MNGLIVSAVWKGLVVLVALVVLTVLNSSARTARTNRTARTILNGPASSITSPEVLAAHPVLDNLGALVLVRLVLLELLELLVQDRTASTARTGKNCSG